MATTAISVADTCAAAKRASRTLATLSSGVKDAALQGIAAAIEDHTVEVLEANVRDLEAAGEGDYSSAFLDKLALDESRIAAMASGVRKIVSLPDPVGEVIDGWRLPNWARRPQGQGSPLGRRWSRVRGATQRDDR